MKKIKQHFKVSILICSLDRFNAMIVIFCSEKYPGRVAIDSMVRDSSMEVEGSAVSAPGQMSQV